ncbi:MAG: hypothetical protein HUU32_19505 [Calditrichaceae bacterium]|nr:hypothetical protein [Calditrichaceae bacterium]
MVFRGGRIHPYQRKDRAAGG